MEANEKIPVFTKGLRSRPLTFKIMNIVNSDVTMTLLINHFSAHPTVSKHSSFFTTYLPLVVTK